MFEELVELVVGPWLFAGLAIFGAASTQKGKDTMRAVAKETVRAGFALKNKSAGLVEQFQQQKSEFMAEMAIEQKEENHKKSTAKKKKAAAATAADEE
jgi:hypothetical protein